MTDKFIADDDGGEEGSGEEGPHPPPPPPSPLRVEPYYSPYFMRNETDRINCMPTAMQERCVPHASTAWCAGRHNLPA